MDRRSFISTSLVTLGAGKIAFAAQEDKRETLQRTDFHVENFDDTEDESTRVLVPHPPGASVFHVLVTAKMSEDEIVCQSLYTRIWGWPGTSAQATEWKEIAKISFNKHPDMIVSSFYLKSKVFSQPGDFVELLIPLRKEIVSIQVYWT